MWLWAILCVIALGLLLALFFPFVFRIDFELDERGANAALFLFKKELGRYEKTFGATPKAESKASESVAKEPAPEKESKAAPKEEPTEEPAEEPTEKPTEIAPKEEPAKPSEERAAKPEEEAVAETSPVKPAEEKETVADSKKDEPAQETPDESHEKEEKRSLTDKEFWTLILTPEFDERAWWSLKHWLSALFKLFRVRFENCFVEGFRMQYQNMGYAAALNAFLKAYPYIGAWDFRMDWTYSHEPRLEGHVKASVNLCRLIGLLVATLFYGGVIAFVFWRRRAHILKTNKLPELGFIRQKIVKMMSEDN